jgi:hypothetical protein
MHNTPMTKHNSLGHKQGKQFKTIQMPLCSSDFPSFLIKVRKQTAGKEEQ